MSTKVRNSLSTYLEQAQILTNNSLNTIDAIDKAMNSGENSIKLVLEDPSNPDNKREYDIPSFSYLKNSIERLEASMKSMSNLEYGGSTLVLTDGSYRKIIASAVPTEAPTITNVNNITTFKFKSNWFFEDLLNPCLYVNWDFSNQIDIDTERVLIKRFILNCDTSIKQDKFNDHFNGKNDIIYDEFVSYLVSQQDGIKFNIDEEIKDLPPRSRRYRGEFIVTDIETEVNAAGRMIRRFRLNKNRYTDTRALQEDTCLLSTGDSLEVMSNPVTTRYEVTKVDGNYVYLTCVEGVEAIGKGTKFRISSARDNSVSAEIPIGFNERQVIFVKAIDPDSNIPSSVWSPGVGFYTNELTYTDTNGKKMNLQRFYQKNVVDFGQVLLSYGDDYYPSIREGIQPDAPVLNYDPDNLDSSNFKIVQINKQLEEGVDIATFREKYSRKISVQNEIKEKFAAIEAKKSELQQTEFLDENHKLSANNELKSLIAQYSNALSEFDGIVNDIKLSHGGKVVTPKYRVRGFWDIPASKVSPSSGEQKIIKFKIRYRYLSESGVANKEEEISYYAGAALIKGRFSNWNEIETKLRPRVKTQGALGVSWEWADINPEDPEEVCINQLDIPIQSGERVEIQIKSVSEAGFPANPMESEWSEPITISFKDWGLSTDDITELISQNMVDAALATMKSNFQVVNNHMSSSFYGSDSKYFAHDAESITSGFLTEEQKPITLYDKLHDLQTQLDVIAEKIINMQGKYIIKLVDNSDETKTYSLTEGGTTYVYAGDYVSEVIGLDSDKRNGHIVEKQYYLDITCDNTSGLQLMSRLGGNRLSMCPSTISSENAYINPLLTTGLSSTSGKDVNIYGMYDNIVTPSTTSSYYYKTKGRYDLVPINLTHSDVIDFQIASPNMYQSAQCKGQFVYSRFRDVTDSFDLYANAETTNILSTNVKCGYFKETGSFIDAEVQMGTDTGYNFGSTSVNNRDVQTLDGTATNLLPQAHLTKIAMYGLDSNATAEDIEKAEFDTYCDLTGTIGLEYDSSMNIGTAYPVLYRLPKTWKKPVTASKTLVDNRKVIQRLYTLSNEGNNTELVSSVNSRLTNRAKAIKTKSNNVMSYSHEPKIQTAYGFGDLGLIKGCDFDESGTADTGSYLTTHKIGYENKDRYAIGEQTCNSFLFLNPGSHSEIQVNGDTARSSIEVSNLASNSIKVPILFQYRMTDYAGNIFGKSGLKATDDSVKQAEFANIIGLDIWSDISENEPLQFDIVFYSKYSSSDVSLTRIGGNTSTKALIDATKDISNRIDTLVKSSKTVNSVNLSETEKLKR